MPLEPLDSTHGRTTSGVAFHHGPWKTHTVEQRRAWHAIIALERQKGSNDIGRGMPSSLLNELTQSEASVVVCHHLPWTANTVKRCRGWHAITAFGQHTQSHNVEHGMPSSPFGNTNGWTASGVACHHRPWTVQTIGRRRAWYAIIALGQHTRAAMSGVALHYRPWTANTVERRLAWHDITAIRLPARSDDNERGMTSPPLDNKHSL